MKVMRYKKLGGRKVPRSYHVLNKRKDYLVKIYLKQMKKL